MKLEVTGQNTAGGGGGGGLYTQNTAEFYRVSSSSVQLSTDQHTACEGTPIKPGKEAHTRIRGSNP